MKIYKEKGITLIALVITVILMLILAGVAISALTGDGGLFNNTRGAAETFENASQREAKQIEGLMNEIDGYIGDLSIDKKAPSVAKLEVSNMTDTSFTLTATGEDDRGVVKYEFYLKNADGNFDLEKTIEVNENTATYNVTGKPTKYNSYVYKLKVYDEAGNSTESPEKTAGVQKAAIVAKIGDYINYDAGEWTTADLTKITSSTGNPTLHSTVNDATTGNQTVPTVQGQFGGFELGQSRNTNSTGYIGTNGVEYAPNTAGWRVWNIDTDTGVVTLISAGHTETYYHAVYESTATLNILKNRNYTMYVNDYATVARILTGQEAASWYNARFGTNYSITENAGNNSTFYGKTFETEEPISVLDNGGYSWLASAWSSANLYFLRPWDHTVSSQRNCAFGIRVLITLKADVLLEQGTAEGEEDSPLRISDL